MEKRIRVALYARVSRPEQILENQFIVLRREVESHPDWDVFDEYSDKCSGATQNRPDLDRLMNDVHKHRIDMILATKLDRMCRSTLNLARICADLEKNRVGLKFVEQDIDTTSPEGKMVRTMLGAVAEYELELIHSRTRDGIARARAEGKQIGRPSTVLSDYQIAKAKEILAAEPDISQRQFADRFQGIGRKQLINELRKMGIWTK